MNIELVYWNQCAEWEYDIYNSIYNTTDIFDN